MGNREALLEAAIICLRERGYGSTTARDVAGTAGVSLGAIRYHFGSMEGLLNEAIAECGRRWITQFKTAMTGSHSDVPQDGLLTSVNGLFDVFERERLLLVGFVEAFAHAQRSPQAREQLAGHYDEFRHGIAAGLQAAFGDEITGSDTIASILIAVVDGLMIQWLLDTSRRLDPAAMQGIVTGIASALGAAAPQDGRD